MFEFPLLQEPAHRAVQPLLRGILIPVAENRVPELSDLRGDLIDRNSAEPNANSGLQFRILNCRGDRRESGNVSMPRGPLKQEVQTIHAIWTRLAQVRSKCHVAQVHRHNRQAVLQTQIQCRVTGSRDPMNGSQ